MEKKFCNIYYGKKKRFDDRIYCILAAGYTTPYDYILCPRNEVTTVCGRTNDPCFLTPIGTYSRREIIYDIIMFQNNKHTISGQCV